MTIWRQDSCSIASPLSYVVFFRRLAAIYEKRDLGEIDRMAVRGCQSARVRSVDGGARIPVLDKPEMLEFPNETWAAQDMRKSEVFKFAAVRRAPNASDLRTVSIFL